MGKTKQQALLSSVVGDQIIELHEQKIIIKDKTSGREINTITREDEQKLYTIYKRLIS